MYKGKKIVAIIPARKGSKGIKNKNIKILCGHPLISYSINYAKKSKFIDRVFVTTDSVKIANISKKLGAEIIFRPKKLCNDVVMSDYAVVHAIKYIENNLKYKFDYIVFLQPTTPLRKKGEIDDAIILGITKKLDTVFSSTNYKPFLWKKFKNTLKPTSFNPYKRKRRQIDSNINETGSYYITKKDIFIKFKNRFGKKVQCFNSDIHSALEIDELNEFKYVSYLLNTSIPKKFNILIPKKN